jgi:hypothetical protein
MTTRSTTWSLAFVLGGFAILAPWRADAAGRAPQCPGSRALMQIVQGIDTVTAPGGPEAQHVRSLLLLCQDGTATLSSTAEVPGTFPFLGAVDTGRVPAATMATLRGLIAAAHLGQQGDCETDFLPGNFSPYKALLRWTGGGAAPRTRTFTISAPVGTGPRCSQAVMDAFAGVAYSSATAVYGPGGAQVIAAIP